MTYEGMAATLTDVKVMVRVSDARNHFFSSMMSGGGGNLTLSSLEMKATPSAEWYVCSYIAIDIVYLVFD